jgi:hypothetical protein
MYELLPLNPKVSTTNSTELNTTHRPRSKRALQSKISSSLNKITPTSRIAPPKSRRKKNAQSRSSSSISPPQKKDIRVSSLKSTQKKNKDTSLSPTAQILNLRKVPTKTKAKTTFEKVRKKLRINKKRKRR